MIPAITPELNSDKSRKGLQSKNPADFIPHLYISCLFYAIADMCFTNSFMLLYLAKLGVPSERILLYLSLPTFVSTVSLIFFAQWTERLGTVFIGVIGLSLGTLCMILLIMAGFLPKPFLEPIIIVSMSVYGVGVGMYIDCWFPLISWIVPAGSRGWFLGNNRLSYQAGTIMFIFLVTWTLGRNSSLIVFQLFFAGIVLLRIFGVVMFSKIPDLAGRFQNSTGSVWKCLSNVLRKEGFIAFSSYVFLLSLFIGACPSIFSLLAKDTLHMTADQVMFIGNLITIGALPGFFIVSRLMDRIGTKHIFMYCHFSFSVILIAFLFREFMPVPVFYYIAALALSFGLVQASSSVAISSEMLAVIPKENKAMAVAVNLSLMNLGISLSGIFSSQMLKMGMFSHSWKMFRCELGSYDSLLLICGVMVLLLVVTLGLIPSVIKSTPMIEEQTNH